MLPLMLYLFSALALRAVLKYYERTDGERLQKLDERLQQDSDFPIPYRTVVHLMCLTPVLNLALLLSIVPLYHQFTKEVSDEDQSRDREGRSDG